MLTLLQRLILGCTLILALCWAGTLLPQHFPPSGCSSIIRCRPQTAPSSLSKNYFHPCGGNRYSSFATTRSTGLRHRSRRTTQESHTLNSAAVTCSPYSILRQPHLSRPSQNNRPRTWPNRSRQAHRHRVISRRRHRRTGARLRGSSAAHHLAMGRNPSSADC